MKSKVERRKWWKGLNSLQQADYMHFRVEKKQRDRKEAEERDWKSAIIGDLRKFSCKTCFHRLTKSCPALSKLGRICRYFWRPGSGKIGLAYEN